MKKMMMKSFVALMMLGAFSLASFAQETDCQRAAKLEMKDKELFALYGTLDNRQGEARKPEVKAQIAANTTQLNDARQKCAASSRCADVPKLEKEHLDMNLLYNTLTANKDAARKQELKAQIATKGQEIADAKKKCASATRCGVINSNYVEKAVGQWTDGDKDTAIWLLSFFSPTINVPMLQSTSTADVIPLVLNVCQQPVDCQTLNSNYLKKPYQNWTDGDRNTAISLLNINKTPVSLLQSFTNEQIYPIIISKCM
jgi:hypothetical protein